MNQISREAGMSMMNLMLHLEALRYHELYTIAASTPAGLVIGSGSAAKVKIANTVSYLWNGTLKTKTTAEVAFTAVTDDIPANASSVQEQVYAVCLDSAGTASLVKGGISTGLNTALYPTAPIPTAIPPTVAQTGALTVIGYVRISVAAGATSFVAATTLLSNGALTVVYEDRKGIIASYFFPV